MTKLRVYVESLIAELEEAKQRAHRNVELLPDRHSEIPAYEQEWEHSEPASLAERFGVDRNLFPSEHHLDDYELEILTEKLQDVFKSHQPFIQLPEAIDTKSLYDILVKIWNIENLDAAQATLDRLLHEISQRGSECNGF